jgi:hypothetical protein
MSEGASGTGLPGNQRIVWMLWLQGPDAAPELVRACHRSWVERNPGWEVRLLSRETVTAYLDEHFARQLFSLLVPPQKIANLIRLYLLSRHGGVWADADCWCAQPLDGWLPDRMAGGFFAFRFPADAWLNSYRHRRLMRIVARSPDRIMDNWFLAGVAGNFISSTFLREHMALLQSSRSGLVRRRLRLATALLRRNPYLSAMLSSRWLLRLAAMFPYPVFHFHFARLLLEDEAFDAAWRAVPAHSVVEALRYGRTLGQAVDPVFLDDMAGRGAAPVFKLHWDVTDGASIAGSRYRWLVDQAKIDPQ